MSVDERGDAVVTAARAGDDQAWAELHQRHARRLLVWLRSLPSGDTAAGPDDLAAEAWLTAASKINYFAGTDDEFAAWLFAIARYVAANHRRRSSRRRTDPIPWVAGSEAGWAGQVADIADAIDDQQATRALLAQLSTRQAEVVALIDVVGLDTAAAAVVLGISPTAVRVTRHRALGRLRTILDAGAGLRDDGRAPTTAALTSQD